MTVQEGKIICFSQRGVSARGSGFSRDSGVSQRALNESSGSTDLSVEEMWSRLMRNFVLEQDRVQNTALLQDLLIPLPTKKLPHAIPEQLSCGHERVVRSGSKWFSAVKCAKCYYRGFYMPSLTALATASFRDESDKEAQEMLAKFKASRDIVNGGLPPAAGVNAFTASGDLHPAAKLSHSPAFASMQRPSSFLRDCPRHKTTVLHDDVCTNRSPFPAVTGTDRGMKRSLYADVSQEPFEVRYGYLPDKEKLLCKFLDEFQRKPKRRSASLEERSLAHYIERNSSKFHTETQTKLLLQFCVCLRCTRKSAIPSGEAEHCE